MFVKVERIDDGETSEESEGLFLRLINWKFTNKLDR